MKKYNEESSHLPVQSVLNVEEIDNWTKKKNLLGIFFEIPQKFPKRSSNQSNL